MMRLSRLIPSALDGLSFLNPEEIAGLNLESLNAPASCETE